MKSRDASSRPDFPVQSGKAALASNPTPEPCAQT
jgi:hypothetical protein